MRLWHQKLLPKLPRQQLLGQHRECCALRGKGWGRSHSIVNYVFAYSPSKLYQYHMLVMLEMEARGYCVNSLWKDSSYRGLQLTAHKGLKSCKVSNPIYPEHDVVYLEECLENLRQKKIYL